MLGVFVATGEVRKRLGTVDGRWLLGGTWGLFAAYVVVPLALFWVLDRTGATSDTSVFAAFLIGLGYQGIIAGGNQSLRVPGDVSAFWTPFVAYADRIAKTALDRGARDQRRLADKVIAEIMQSQDRYDRLHSLALDRSSDTTAVEARLAEIDGTTGLGAGDKLAKKTRYLYGTVLSVPDIVYLLRSNEIVGRGFYWLSIRHLKRLVALAVLLLVLAAVGIYAGYASYTSRPVRVTYHAWRLGKTNSTPVDQYRSRREIVLIMASSQEHRRVAAGKLLRLVQLPGLPLERVDLVLQTLLETHPPSLDNDLPPKLTQTLRVGSLDARTRVHDALLFLAAPCPAKPDGVLNDWKPTEKDSSTTLEEKITAWTAYWGEGCRGL